MALPRILKDMMVFNDGVAYVGQAAQLTVPKLTRKLEEWRGAGMDSAIKLDMGGEPLEAEFSCGGPMREVLRQHGVMSLSAVMLRFAGAFQNDSTGEYDSIEVTVRGRHEEIDFGDWKVGEAGEFKVKSALSYYRLDWNGTTEIEVDPINGVLVVGGVDRLAGRNAALGL